MHASTVLVIILAAGLGSQWIAAKLRLPGILVMIAAGVALGPLTGIVTLDVDQADLTELIGVGVAIVLFEGAMDLRVGEIRKVGAGVRRLTILAPPLAWGLGAVAAHYAGGLSWPVSWVLGAILVVTGPTVILPLLRQARLRKDIGSLLKWEGIVNDPVGVLLAVLTFQFLTLSGEGVASTAVRMLVALAAAAFVGGGGGWVVAKLYRRGWVPPHLKGPLLVVLVPGVFWTTNLVQNEAGLLAVTLMGLVIGNARLVERERILDFKSSLTVVLLAVLFIVIPGQLTRADLASLDLRAVAFVAAILFLVRPLSIWIATIGLPLSWQEKTLLSWIAPRGIVAAATAGVFGPALVADGYDDATALLPFVFAVIVTTVLAHGLTLGPLARRLGLAASARNGLLIVGASPFAQALGAALVAADIDVLVTDGSYRRLSSLRKAGIPTWTGEILSEHAEDELDASHLNYVLAATDNGFYNALVCRSQNDDFGSTHVFQLPMQKPAGEDTNRLPLQRRGHFAFDRVSDYYVLHGHVKDDWQVWTTSITDVHTPDSLAARLGTEGEDWLMLGAITAAGALRLHSRTHPVTLKPGADVLVFAPRERIANREEETAAALDVLAGAEGESTTVPGHDAAKDPDTGAPAP